jgi:hypothetical protein
VAGVDPDRSPGGRFVPHRQVRRGDGRRSPCGAASFRNDLVFVLELFVIVPGPEEHLHLTEDDRLLTILPRLLVLDLEENPVEALEIGERHLGDQHRAVVDPLGRHETVGIHLPLHLDVLGVVEGV